MTDTTTTDATREQAAPELDERQHRLRRTLEALTGIAFTEGNALTVLRNGDRIFPAMLTAIEQAQHSVDLMTYVYWKGAIATTFADTLCAAARRGVEVDVLLPGPHADKRVCQLASEAAYDRLTSCGVRVWNFQPSRMHAKVMVVDGMAAVVGSSNFNRRSLDHDEEVVAVLLDDEAAGTLLADFDADLERSEQIDLTRWRDRTRRQKLLEAATVPLRRFF